MNAEEVPQEVRYFQVTLSHYEFGCVAAAAKASLDRYPPTSAGYAWLMDFVRHAESFGLNTDM